MRLERHGGRLIDLTGLDYQLAFRFSPQPWVFASYEELEENVCLPIPEYTRRNFVLTEPDHLSPRGSGSNWKCFEQQAVDLLHNFARRRWPPGMDSPSCKH